MAPAEAPRCTCHQNSACGILALRHIQAICVTQECACFGESTGAAGGVQEAMRLDLAAAPIFSLALDPAPATGGRQQVDSLSVHITIAGTLNHIIFVLQH